MCKRNPSGYLINFSLLKFDSLFNNLNIPAFKWSNNNTRINIINAKLIFPFIRKNVKNVHLLDKHFGHRQLRLIIIANLDCFKRDEMNAISFYDKKLGDTSNHWQILFF